jgi:DNA-binding PadR family transcriptional regulator
MKINKELMKGSTVVLVLSVLSKKEMYGYEIMKEIEKRSEGVFHLTEGTLYPILHHLESEGLLKARWVGDLGTRRRKYYRITAEGKSMQEEKTQEWSLFRASVDQVLARGRS